MVKSTFKVRIGVVVIDEANRLLLARQNENPFWVLPGGTLDPGETMGQCAVREIKEEANLNIALGRLLFVGDFFAPNGQQAIDMVFLSTLLSGTLVPETTQNINEIGFYTFQEVRSMPCKPEKLFEQLFEYWENRERSENDPYLGAYL